MIYLGKCWWKVFRYFCIICLGKCSGKFGGIWGKFGGEGLETHYLTLKNIILHKNDFTLKTILYTKILAFLIKKRFHNHLLNTGSRRFDSLWIRFRLEQLWAVRSSRRFMQVHDSDPWPQEVPGDVWVVPWGPLSPYMGPCNRLFTINSSCTFGGRSARLGRGEGVPSIPFGSMSAARFGGEFWANLTDISEQL